MTDIKQFQSLVFKYLNDKDVEVGEFEVNYSGENWNEIEILYQPVLKSYRATLKNVPLDDDSAERIAFQIERVLYPERIERQLLEAAMDVINYRPEVIFEKDVINVNQEKHEEV